MLSEIKSYLSRHQKISAGARQASTGWNMYNLLIIRLLIVFALYLICRIFFWIYNADLLHINDFRTALNIFKGGLLFDASGIIYLNVLVILMHILPLSLKFKYGQGYQRAIKWVYMVCNIAGLILNLGDTVYYRFTGRRTTLSVFMEFGNENPFSFLRFFWTYWPITLVGIALIALLFYSYARVRPLRPIPNYRKLIYYPSSILLFLLLPVLFLIIARGGTSVVRHPIAPSEAMHYAERPEQMAMVINTPFSMIRLISKRGLSYEIYMSAEEARQLFDPLRLEPEKTERTGLFRGRNVVLIIWESGGKEWVGALNKGRADGYEGFTPFLDSLIGRSYCFDRAFASGSKSIDAMPALLAGVPKPQEPFVSSPYALNAISGLPKALREAGYRTTFFHNSHLGSMGFDAITRQLGFQEGRWMESFGDDSEFDGAWGIWDEPFLQYIANELDSLPQPFFVTEFTTSSHDPFNIPKKYEKVFTDKKHPLHRCIRYTDHALRRFFQTASKKSWYSNTLFIIVADHAAAGYLKDYKNSLGGFSIPLVIFDPQGSLIGRDATVVQQADLTPTLLDLLDIRYPAVLFGQNIFDPKAKHFAVSSLDGGVFQIIKGDYLLQYDGKEVLNLYNYKVDPELQEDLKDREVEQRQDLTLLLQAWIQQLGDRMEGNNLVAN